MKACGIIGNWSGGRGVYGSAMMLLCLFGLVVVDMEAADSKVVTLPLSEDLIISAETVSPAMDEKTGDLIGLSASGQVSVKVRPKGTEKWIYVTCGELVYDVNNDEIVLKGRPVVKSGIQVLKATSDKTYVHVSRKTGKWVIKGPHKIQLKLK